MTALAGLLKERGFSVSGADLDVYPPMSTFLNELKIPVHIGFDAEHLASCPDLVVVGNAMSRGNPEVEAVLNQKIDYVSLPIALREFFIRGKISCVVAGTHGKTTTSSLLAWVLENAGRDPGFFIGGIPENFGKGYKLGSGEVFVSEGDEYDSAFFDKHSKFLHYLPDLVILNNIEFDHADIFKSYDDVEIAFKRLINIIPGNGYLVASWDDENVKRLCENAFSNVVSFGLQDGALWQAKNIDFTRKQTNFEVYFKNSQFDTFSTPLTGQHNVKNCLAVIAAATELGLTKGEISAGISSFKNVRRRMQLKGEVNGVKVFDDFAHHPTEIKATLDGARKRYPHHRIWAIYEPRTATSKRRVLEDQFVESLDLADHVVLAPLHRQDKVPANERLVLENVCRKLTGRNIPNRILPANDEMVDYLANKVEKNDLLLFMSNGDFNQIPEKLLAKL